MIDHNAQADRLAELLAGAQLQDLSPEEHAELDQLLQSVDEQELPNTLGELLVMLDEHDATSQNLPAHLSERLASSGRAAIASQHPEQRSSYPIQSANGHKNSWVGWIAGFAAVLAIGTGIFAYSTLQSGWDAQREYELQLEALQAKIDQNENLLSKSRLAAEETQRQLNLLDQQLHDAEIQIAQSEQEKLGLAQQLADATTDLRDAQLKIAKYETPVDPAVLAERRQQLLEVPDSIQIAWQPFNLPDSPAEQLGVRGDVVWSDDLQEGYIRFVGLEPNDPNIEQYQVWVIDERGLEQKVSGGVFNASAEGEIIVPIEPGIDVGRVALFAVTVENPGGTWVPDLSRRVVIAPRES
ncbi:MAG: anti-sigma factor [Phycisphaerales bacterium]